MRVRRCDGTSATRVALRAGVWQATNVLRRPGTARSDHLAVLPGACAAQQTRARSNHAASTHTACCNDARAWAVCLALGCLQRRRRSRSGFACASAGKCARVLPRAPRETGCFVEDGVRDGGSWSCKGTAAWLAHESGGSEACKGAVAVLTGLALVAVGSGRTRPCSCSPGCTTTQRRQAAHGHAPTSRAFRPPSSRVPVVSRPSPRASLA